MYVNKNLRKQATLALAGIALAGSCAIAQAAVVYEDVDFLSTSPSSPIGFATKVSSFNIDAAGIYEVTLADFVFPEAFDSISLAISTFIGPETVGSIDGEGTFTFFASGAGKYYASLFADPGDTFGVGLYGVQVSSLAAPVPLPPGIILMLSAIGLLVGLRGKNKAPAQNTASLSYA